MARLVAAALVLLGMIAAMLAFGGLPWANRTALPVPAASGPAVERGAAAHQPVVAQPAGMRSDLPELRAVTPLRAEADAPPDTQTLRGQTETALGHLRRKVGMPEGDPASMEAMTRIALQSLRRNAPVSRLDRAVQQAVTAVGSDSYLAALHAEAGRGAGVQPADSLPARLSALVAKSAPAAAADPRPAAGPLPRKHRVGAGETLTTLAEAVYGRASAWAAIWEANRDRMASPDALRSGMLIVLPAID